MIVAEEHAFPLIGLAVGSSHGPTASNTMLNFDYFTSVGLKEIFSRNTETVVSLFIYFHITAAFCPTSKIILPFKYALCK